MGDTEQEREGEAESRAEGEAGSMQGAQCGTRSWDSRIMPWAEGRHQTTEPPRDPFFSVFSAFVPLWGCRGFARAVVLTTRRDGGAAQGCRGYHTAAAALLVDPACALACNCMCACRCGWA